MFLKLEKVHLESSRYRKTTLDISVSDHLSIYAYLFLFKSKAIECFLENIVPENMVSFPDLFFFPHCLRKMFYSNCTCTVCNFTKS